MVRTVCFASLLLLSCATSMVPRSSSRTEVEAYVNRAAAIVADSGAAACSTFRQPDWFAGEWYIFVFDETGRTVCHPARPEMVGTMASALVDDKGVRFGDAFMSAANDAGGWVDYTWTRPGSTVAVPKSSYVRSVMYDGKRYVVGSGGYSFD